MTADKAAKSAIELLLPQEARQRIEAMMGERSDDFVALVRKAGLDPCTSFRGKVLRVDFGTADLTGFDFSGADLTACNLSSAKLGGAIMTGARCGVEPRFLAKRAHKHSVYSVAFSTDGTRIVSGGGDGTLRLWDAATGAALGKPLRGHEGLVSAVTFSPDGKRIVSGGDDGMLCLWDIATGTALVEPFRGHDSFVSGVAFSPEGARIISTGDHGKLRLWDANTGAALGNPIGGHEFTIENLTFSPDGTRIVSGSAEGMLLVWDASSGQPIGEPLSRREYMVPSVAISPDCTRIIRAGKPGTLELLDVATGAPLGNLRGHRDHVLMATFSPDGSCIVSKSDDGKLRLWDAAMGAALGEPLSDHTGWVYCMAFSPAGTRIVSGDSEGTLHIWFLDPPVCPLFISARPEDAAYQRALMARVLKHPEMMRRHVVEAFLGPLVQPRPDKAARASLETAVAALFIVGSHGLAFIQQGEMELARRLQRKTGRPRIIPIFTESAVTTESAKALKGYQFIHMPLEKPDALEVLIETICQAIDAPPSINERGEVAERAEVEQDIPTTDGTYSAMKTKSRKARVQRKRIDRLP